MDTPLAGPASYKRNPSLTTQTNCCCGVLRLRVGVILVALWLVLDGAWPICVRFSGLAEDVQWGPVHWEAFLQGACVALGAFSIVVGLCGVMSTWSLRLTAIRWFQRGLLVCVLWKCLWVLLVGLPRTPASRTLSKGWRSVARGLKLEREQWVRGQPCLCAKVEALKLRLGHAVEAPKKKWWVRLLLRRLHKQLRNNFLRCRSVLLLFWSSAAATIGIGIYSLTTISYFYSVVRHGGNGVIMIGCLTDLDREVGNRKSFVLKRMMSIFKEIDRDGDGKVTAEEFVSYLECRNEALTTGSDDPSDDEGQMH